MNKICPVMKLAAGEAKKNGSADDIKWLAHTGQWNPADKRVVKVFVFQIVTHQFGTNEGGSNAIDIDTVLRPFGRELLDQQIHPALLLV